MKAALFVRHFQLGTQLSDHLTAHEIEIEFLESLTELTPDFDLAIVDLDDKSFGTVDFISILFRKGIKTIGYLKYRSKDIHDKYKSAGCSVILTRSSIVKNITTLVKELDK